MRGVPASSPRHYAAAIVRAAHEPHELLHPRHTDVLTLPRKLLIAESGRLNRASAPGSWPHNRIRYARTTRAARICQEHKDDSPPSFSPFSPADTLPLADRPRRPAHGPHRAARRPAAAASGRRPDRVSTPPRISSSRPSARVRVGTQADAEARGPTAPASRCALTFDVDNELYCSRAATPLPVHAVARRVRRDDRLCPDPGAPRSAAGAGHLLHPGGQRDAPSRHDPRDREGRPPRDRRPRLDSREPASVRDAAQEERLLNQAIDYLTKATGKRPVGYRAPSWAFSANTIGQILKAGFLYDSSFMAMDEPYELVSNGKPTGLTELPIEWIMDDCPYYSGNASGVAAVARSGPADLQGRVRGRVPGADDVRADDCTRMCRATVAPMQLEKLDHLHEVEARRVVRDAGADRQRDQVGEPQPLKPAIRIPQSPQSAIRNPQSAMAAAATAAGDRRRRARLSRRDAISARHPA